MTALDSRLNAFRSDLADERLRGRVEARFFVGSRPAKVGVAVADLRRKPDLDASVETQLLFGDAVQVFEEGAFWSWVQAVRDGYVGYVPTTALRQPAGPATHVVAVPRSFTYPGPELRSPATGCLSLGMRGSGDRLRGSARQPLCRARERRGDDGRARQRPSARTTRITWR